MLFAPSKIWLRANILNRGILKTTNDITIKVKMLSSSQEPPASSKAPNDDLKDMDALCTFKSKIERRNSNYGFIKDEGLYRNEDQDDKLHSGTTSVLQSPKWGLKGHGCSLHHQKQDREPNFRTLVYQRSVTISQSKWRCQTPVRNIQHPRKPQNRI